MRDLRCNPQRYLDPAILARVGFSPLLAQVVVEGFLNGFGDAGIAVRLRFCS